MIPLINPKITSKQRAGIGGRRLPESAGHRCDCPPLHRDHVEISGCEGKSQERKLHDFDARVVQHEVDHLEGVLIVDYQKI